jgi:hypothetical protein
MPFPELTTKAGRSRAQKAHRAHRAHPAWRRTRHKQFDGQGLYQLQAVSIREGEAIVNERGRRFVVQTVLAKTGPPATSGR